MPGPSSFQHVATNKRASDFVDAQRLWQRTNELSRIGATPSGGCCRLAFTEEDGIARATVIAWARALGATCLTDGIANLFLRFESASTDITLAPVMTGSHLDTEPDGGRFDGVFGVLAGLEAIAAIQDAGIGHRRPLEVVIWSNEEGCRFQPGCMGSWVHVEPSKLEEILSCRDEGELSVRDALPVMTAKYKVDSVRETGESAAAFVEAHIEQGPVLETLAADIGVVTSIYGSCRIGVEVIGEASHAGTTPRSARRDAFVSAVQIVSALHEAFHEREDVLRLTIGRFSVVPGSPSVVPGRVSFTIDMRHPEQRVLDRKREDALEICRKAAGRCRPIVDEIIRVPCTALNQDLQSRIAHTSKRLGLATHSMASGAGHDSRNLARHCRTAMIFVPSRNGISHNPDEYTSPEQLANGAKVLAEVIAELAQT